MQKSSDRGNQNSSSSCEYCYIQSKTKNIDFNHPIAKCPKMAALHGSLDILNDVEEVHEFETFAQEFIELNDLPVMADNVNDLEEVVDYQEVDPMNIFNIQEQLICARGGDVFHSRDRCHRSYSIYRHRARQKFSLWKSRQRHVSR